MVVLDLTTTYFLVHDVTVFAGVTDELLSTTKCKRIHTEIYMKLQYLLHNITNAFKELILVPSVIQSWLYPV